MLADADGLRPGEADEPGGPDTALAFERIAPAFALHTDFPGAEEPARRLPEIRPGLSVDESGRIVAQCLELGYPVLEFGQNDRVPVTPDWGVARHAECRARRERAARGLPVPEEATDDEGVDLEDAAVRERLEFLNEAPVRAGRPAVARGLPRRPRR